MNLVKRHNILFHLILHLCSTHEGPTSSYSVAGSAKYLHDNKGNPCRESASTKSVKRHGPGCPVSRSTHFRTSRVKGQKKVVTGGNAKQTRPEPKVKGALPNLHPKH